MRWKGDAHEVLSLVFHCNGIPLTMILDGSKNKTLSEFRQNLRKDDSHLKQTESYCPWMQAMEGCIQELKRVVSRKMINWIAEDFMGHYIELKALIWSCMSNDIYMTGERSLRP